MNTVLDDIAAVIGFSATLKLVAWFGDGIANLYVPAIAEEGQLLPRIIGLSAAKAMSKEWPKKHLNVPRLHNYETELRKRHIARMIEKGYSLREIAGQLQMSERRVSQVKEELRSSGLLTEAAEPGQGSVSTAAAPSAPAVVASAPPAAASGQPAAKVVSLPARRPVLTASQVKRRN